VPKPNDDIQELKRRLANLSRLEGRALVCAEGAVVLAPVRVLDPRPIVEACAKGPPALNAIQRGLELASPPVALSPRLLATAHRDLRILETSPSLVALSREARRIFRRYGDLDEAWIANMRAHLSRLSEMMAAGESEAERGDTSHPAWLRRVLAVIGFLYESAAVEAVERALHHLIEDERARRSDAQRFFAHYALAFDPRPQEGEEAEAFSVTRKVMARGLAELDAVIARFGGRKLGLAQVRCLMTLALDGHEADIAGFVEKGLPLEKVARLSALGRATDLFKLGTSDPGTMAAYADWASTLLPHYKALGLDLPITPETFARLRVPRKEDLAVLAVCLMKHHGKAEPEAAERALARFDATLGLFQRRPAEAASIMAELSGTSPGAGRAAFPAFADWLGDDALLDRFVHLSRIAGVPVALSQRLRADFERAAQRTGQREHLAALQSRTPAQEERLSRLARSEGTVVGPERTRRRVAERIRELLALGYERKLDAVFRRILKEVWGISLARIGPGWRDAIRFYLAVDENHELLGTLLRAAAAGADLARSLPKNAAFLAEARVHFDVDAWLAPRAREVMIGGRSYRISVEQDPIEVLRMGIPFDTCLSLEDGCNAASTVVNAIDASKRVVYLRDARGGVVARKLLAVSEEYTLLGYRLYIADGTHREAITEVFRAFCAEIAAAARLPLATSGKARQIHPGFWYDDGVVPLDGAPEDAPVKAYCRSLGMPLPRTITERLRREARIFGALRRKDEEAVLAALRDSYRPSGIRARAAAWLLPRLSPARLIAAARTSPVLAVVAIRRAAEVEGPAAMFALAGRIANWASASEVAEMIPCLPRSTEVAKAFVAAALASRRNASAFDDHGLEHQTLYHLHQFVEAMPIDAALELCDQVAPLWPWIAEVSPGCQSCVQAAERDLCEAIAQRYASARDPEAVIRCLGRGKKSLLARRAALRIAAQYALAEDVTAPTLPPPRKEPLRPSPAAMRALARLRKREPSLDAKPDMLAAILRQSGGIPRGLLLPVPHEKPFHALGDLLLQLDLGALLARFRLPDGDLESWKPDRWEYHFHKRSLAEGPRKRRFPAELEKRPDQALVVEAYTLVDRHLAGDALRPEELSAAFETLVRADLEWAALWPIVARLLARGAALTQGEQVFIASAIRAKFLLMNAEVPDFGVAAWPIEALRGPLLDVLLRSKGLLFEAAYRSIEAAAMRAGGAAQIDGLLETGVDALRERGEIVAVADIEDEGVFRRAIRHALQQESAAGAVAIHGQITDPYRAAIFVQELSRSPLRGTEVLRTQVALTREERADADERMLLEWLESCL
jgi:hypothetical protein